jgi:hypothetical protein
VRTPRTPVFVAVPVAVYLLLLLLVAGLYVRPPALGWIGLGVVAAVGALLVLGVTVLFPRMRANVEPAAAPERHRLLVLADAACPAEAVCDSVAARLAGRDPEVLVVAPVLATELHYVATDEESERGEAEARLAAVVAGLRRRGLRAEGRLGDDDPLQALGDALADFPAGEALVVTPRHAHWLERGLFERARRLVPVLEHVEAA